MLAISYTNAYYIIVVCHKLQTKNYEKRCFIMANVNESVKVMESFGRFEPWHFGTSLDGVQSVQDAMQRADLAWEVNQAQAYIQDKNGNWIETPAVVNYRSDNGLYLGTVTDRYQKVDNSEAFSFLDVFDNYKFISGGVVNGGKTAWVCIEVQGFDVLGDTVKQYYIFSNTHDGSGSLRVCLTPVRAVCSNTLNLALKKATRAFSLRHKGDTEGKIAMIGDILSHDKVYQKEFIEQSERLAKINLSDMVVDKMLMSLFPYDREKDTDRKIRNMIEQQDAVKHCYRCDDLGNFQNTAYGFINAVSDMAYHSTPKRMTSTYRENQMLSVIKGNKLLDKALLLVDNL